ncbi:hypothetical protein ACRAWF_45940 [Streptomyces sp. L7]
MDKFKGRKVFYIPIVQQVPAFVATAGSTKQALSKVGLSQQVCDGKAQPTAIASCVQQAITRGRGRDHPGRDPLRHGAERPRRRGGQGHPDRHRGPEPSGRGHEQQPGELCAGCEFSAHRDGLVDHRRLQGARPM